MTVIAHHWEGAGPGAVQTDSTEQTDHGLADHQSGVDVYACRRDVESGGELSKRGCVRTSSDRGPNDECTPETPSRSDPSKVPGSLPDVSGYPLPSN